MDMCKHCEYRENLNKCLESNCFQHKNYIVIQLQLEIKRLRRIEKAAIKATDYLPWHWPNHQEYESGISDAGRRLRIALWPDKYESHESDII